MVEVQKWCINKYILPYCISSYQYERLVRHLQIKTSRQKTNGQILEIKKSLKKSKGKILEIKKSFQKSNEQVVEIKKSFEKSNGKILEIKISFQKSNGRILEIKKVVSEIRDSQRIKTNNYFRDTPRTP